MNFFCLTSVSLSRQGSVIGLQLNKSKFKNLFLNFVIFVQDLFYIKLFDWITWLLHIVPFHVPLTLNCFSYVGHGAGARFLDSQAVLKRQMRAASLLFGCSSAALAVRGDQEGQGIILNYLIAGWWDICLYCWSLLERKKSWSCFLSWCGRSEKTEFTNFS